MQSHQGYASPLEYRKAQSFARIGTSAATHDINNLQEQTLEHDKRSVTVSGLFSVFIDRKRTFSSEF
jgi:hypothetical protein